MDSENGRPSMQKSVRDLSNMVFGVALSIGALTLINNLSVLATPDSITNSIATFAFSFLIIIYMWFRYTQALDLMHDETRIELNLKLLVLLLVAVEPYLFYLLNTASAQLLPFTTTLYALDIAGLLFVLFILYRIGIKSQKGSDRKVANYYLPTSDGLILSAILFAVSALPILWDVSIFGFRVRYALWIAALILGQVFRRASRYARRVKFP